MILLPNPNASKEDYINGLKLTEAEYQVVVSLDERSRCFLVKQGHASSVCQLNLRGMDDVLSVISASTDNIEIMHDIMQQVSAANDIATDDLQPEHWLKIFYENRKGSGKGKAKPSPAPRSRQTTSTAMQP
jgi:type IV secretion system protein VirB4